MNLLGPVLCESLCGQPLPTLRMYTWVILWLLHCDQAPVHSLQQVVCTAAWFVPVPVDRQVELVLGEEAAL